MVATESVAAANGLPGNQSELRSEGQPSSSSHPSPLEDHREIGDGGVNRGEREDLLV